MATRTLDGKRYDYCRPAVCPPGSIVRVRRQPTMRGDVPTPPYIAVAVRITTCLPSKRSTIKLPGPPGLLYVRAPGYDTEFGPLLPYEYRVIMLDLSGRPFVLEERLEQCLSLTTA